MDNMFIKHLFLWGLGIILAFARRNSEEELIKICIIPQWLSRVLFLSKKTEVPCRVVIYQIWIYIFALLSLSLSVLFPTNFALTIYKKLWSFTLFGILFYYFIAYIIGTIKKHFFDNF